MSSRKPRRVPSYRLHKGSRQAVVTLEGRDHYLGKFGSDDSQAEYERLVGEWLIHGRQLPQEKSPGEGPTINELILAYWEEAQRYYQRDGKPTSELESMRLALRYVRRPYGRTFAKDFGPMALKVCREAMIEKGLSRSVCNGYTKRIKRLFRWGVENELILASVFQALQAVRGLRKGRSPARETEPIRPAREEHVEAVLPAVSVPVQAMIRLQLLTGMRPGEVVQMRASDIDRSRQVWTYRPQRHKTDYRGHEREVALGPKAQAVLRPFVERANDGPLFSPRDAEGARNARRRLQRKSPMTPCQGRRRGKSKPQKAPKDRYTTASYRRAIARACERASVPS
ncbi:MAG: tyrosine-type recombinase/integrase, partial [Planctomycetota bacterium]|nr:tyrosine-type recombinase/integrase [Planctomycetota bacterium]